MRKTEMGSAAAQETGQETSRIEVGEARYLLGISGPFLSAVDKARTVARYDVPVLIQGETGTGKELFARYIHHRSPRRSNSFVSINCASLPPELMESEFFGHRRGAFTHAVADREGYVAEAHAGTLLLDEIVSLDLRLQAKLLRFLQEGEYRPVGSRGHRVSDVRVLAATNVPLEGEVEEGRFRQDLFYRLGVYILDIPPLRRRREDVTVLVEHFLRRYSEKFAVQPPTLSSEALSQLRAHPWPGNVRELENVVQRMVIQDAGKSIESARGFIESSRSPRVRLGITEGAEAVGTSFQEAKSQVIREFEWAYLDKLMRTHRGNVSQAARASGKHRRALTELLRKHGLDPGEFRQRKTARPTEAASRRHGRD